MGFFDFIKRAVTPPAKVRVALQKRVFTPIARAQVGRFVGTNLRSPTTAALISLIPHPAAQLAGAGLRGYQGLVSRPVPPMIPIEPAAPPEPVEPSMPSYLPTFTPDSGGPMGFGPLAGLFSRRAAEPARTPAHARIHAARGTMLRPSFGSGGLRRRRRKRRLSRRKMNWSAISKLADVLCAAKDISRRPRRGGYSPSSYDLLQDRREDRRGPRRRRSGRYRRGGGRLRGPRMSEATKAYLREYKRRRR